MHVDPGSNIFEQVVRNVPVLHPKHQYLVSREVRETSLATMTGTPDSEDPAEQDQQQAQLLAEEVPGLHQPEEGLAAQQEVVNSQVKKAV